MKLPTAFEASWVQNHPVHKQVSVAKKITVQNARYLHHILEVQRTLPLARVRGPPTPVVPVNFFFQCRGRRVRIEMGHMTLTLQQHLVYIVSRAIVLDCIYTDFIIQGEYTLYTKGVVQ